MLSPLQAVEFFHLQFARLLCAGPEKGCFAIKGGCNLRFFFESVRYSEDIDLDVTDAVPVHALKEKVSRILSAPALALPLRNRGIQVNGVTAPKQTETTQRWKVGLSVTGLSVPLPTKIEFSRRVTTDEARVEPISPSVAAEHQIMQFLAPHYPLAAALRQKVKALADRKVVQARDVFDLGSVLIPRAGGETDALHLVQPDLPTAIERAISIPYSDFKAQVVSYLHPDQLELHGSAEAWDTMQLQVVEFMERALAREIGRPR
jgi:hypothetical protein